MDFPSEMDRSFKSVLRFRGAVSRSEIHLIKINSPKLQPPLLSRHNNPLVTREGRRASIFYFKDDMNGLGRLDI